MTAPRPTSRKFVNALVFSLASACVVVALVPLGSILFESIVRGGFLLVSHPNFLWAAEAPACPSSLGQSCPVGGIGPALEGTLVLIGVSALLALPLGILTGVYLSEFPGGRGPLGRGVSFFTDVMVGFPSIVVGVFVYSLILLFDRSIVYSTLSGAVALAVLMVPVITRATEESLRLVPTTIREAALALGIPRYRATVRVVLSAGRNLIITGALLGVMRAGGETAPLLLTAFWSQRFFQGLDQPTGAVPTLIFNYAFSPFANWQQDAWGAAFVLILLMLGLSLAARLLLQRRMA